MGVRPRAGPAILVIMTGAGPSRRAVLGAGALGAAVLAAGGLAGVESGALPGTDTVDGWLGRLPSGVPHDRPGPRLGGTFDSARRGAPTGWTVALPPGTAPDGLPVLVVLHGRGGDHRSAFDDLHLDRFLAAAVRHGVAPFAIASVDGGDHSYWHPRRDGDAAGMVVDELLPLLGRHGLGVRRPGLLGWSMGGYGALHLATVLGRSRCAAVIAESPAVWHRADQSAAGAFDDAADWTRHDLWPRLGALRGIAVRIDCGSADGFAPVTRDLRGALSPTPAGGITPGGHDARYWRGRAPAQLAFAGAHLCC